MDPAGWQSWIEKGHKSVLIIIVGLETSQVS